MMKQEDWTKQLRDKLADHQEAVPDDLWAGIEAGLNAPVSQRLTPSSWRRWAVAAAVALLLAGGSLVLWNRGGEEAPYSETAQLTQKPEPIVAQVVKAAKTHEVKVAEAPVVEAVEAPIVESVETTETPAIETAETPAVETAETPESVEETKTPETTKTLPRPQDPFTAAIAEQRHDDHRLMAAVYAGNGFENRYNVDRVQMSQNLADKYNAMSAMTMGTRSDEPIWLANYEEREHHERPFTIGLQLRYPLTERLSLSSGLVYTRLKSEFTKLMKGNEVSQQQQLHYVGVPLIVQYRLLRLGHLNVYASAGGQADWNVSARMGVNGSQFDTTKDHLQWSLSGGLGLAYDLTPHVALFAEPRVKYYFDNHSPVRNYFKDRPTNFSLQVGLQLNVGNK